MTGKQGRALKRKIVIIFLLIGLVPLSVASMLSFLSSQKTLKQVIGEGQRDLAIEVMDKIMRSLTRPSVLVLGLEHDAHHPKRCSHWASAYL
jgi:hypothetical protein